MGEEGRCYEPQVLAAHGGERSHHPDSGTRMQMPARFSDEPRLPQSLTERLPRASRLGRGCQQQGGRPSPGLAGSQRHPDPELGQGGLLRKQRVGSPNKAMETPPPLRGSKTPGPWLPAHLLPSRASRPQTLRPEPGGGAGGRRDAEPEELLSAQTLPTWPGTSPCCANHLCSDTLMQPLPGNRKAGPH